MGEPVDYYDVQRMIRDETDRLRWRIEEEEAQRRAAVDELRETIASLQRVLNSRTEHLV